VKIREGTSASSAGGRERRGGNGRVDDLPGESAPIIEEQTSIKNRAAHIYRKAKREKPAWGGKSQQNQGIKSWGGLSFEKPISGSLLCRKKSKSIKRDSTGGEGTNSPASCKKKRTDILFIKGQKT